MQNMPIGIFRGDDTDAFDYQTIVGTINTDLDLTGCKAVFRYLDFSMEFDPIPEDKKITIIIPADETKKFPPGLGYASLRVYDSEGRLKTFSNRIMVFVATKTPMFGNDEFEVDFNVRQELAPLKIFVGPNPDDFDEYRGYLEKVIDRASATKYGLAILLDAIDSDLGAADGVAATPVAVKAAYSAIIDKLTDGYYTAEQTDEAIDRVAAYYITYDAAGNPFPTYAALANATTVYSGGQVRTPTRNDYCVVLADETHQGAEYRYIYAVAEGQTTGSWQPQFPVEGVMTVDQTVQKNSQNPVSGGGVWSMLWGALALLPSGFSSLYDWCVAQLAGKVPTSRTVNGKALSSDVTLTGADIAVSGTDATKISAALAGKASKSDATLTERGFSAWTIVVSPPPGMEFEAVGQPYYENSGWHIEVRYRATGEEEWVYDTYDQSGGDDGKDSLHVVCGTLFDCTRTVLSGYQLGSQSNKPLASEAEAEALRQGKQDALSAQQLANIAAVPNKANNADVLHNTGGWLVLNANVVGMQDPTGKEASFRYVQGIGTFLMLNDRSYYVPSSDGTLALTADIPYALTTKTIDNGAVTLDDRASNAVTISTTLSPNTLTINFPTATSGEVRDFAMRLNIAAGVTAPEIAWPQGVTLENDGGEVPEIADGGTGGSSTILYFSETENNGTTAKFLVKGETLTAIAQA